MRKAALLIPSVKYTGCSPGRCIAKCITVGFSSCVAYSKRRHTASVGPMYLPCTYLCISSLLTSSCKVVRSDPLYIEPRWVFSRFPVLYNIGVLYMYRNESSTAHRKAIDSTGLKIVCYQSKFISHHKCTKMYK